MNTVADSQKPPRRSNEALITPWIFFRWMLVGLYVGSATVGIFAAWCAHVVLRHNSRPPVTAQQLNAKSECACPGTILGTADLVLFRIVT